MGGASQEWHYFLVSFYLYSVVTKNFIKMVSSCPPASANLPKFFLISCFSKVKFSSSLAMLRRPLFSVKKRMDDCKKCKPPFIPLRFIPVRKMILDFQFLRILHQLGPEIFRLKSSQNLIYERKIGFLKWPSRITWKPYICKDKRLSLPQGVLLRNR